MAKNGFKVFDSDMHIMEPLDLWERYIALEFRSIAPRGRTSDNVRDLGVIFPDGEPNGRKTSGTPPRGRNYEKNQELYRDHSRRGWTAEVQIEAMDVEGVDVAVLFPSRGLSVLTHPDRDPGFAAAIARAYNDWMFDFCRTDTTRLLGAGMISVYRIEDAIEETYRVVEELTPTTSPSGAPWNGSRSRWGFTRRRALARARAEITSSRTSASAASIPSPSSRCSVSEVS
jgi:hypothetical protein